MTRLFFDTEFTDLKKDCDLISIGVVADIEGVEETPAFYAESIEFAEDKCSTFVREQVLPHMKLKGIPMANITNDRKSVAVCGTEEDIASHLDNWIHQFIKSGDKVEVWSDCLAYDWVLFCNLFESIGGLPSYIYYIPFDLSTYLKLRGVDPDISREEFASLHYGKDVAEISATKWNKHNSLFDAMIIYYCYNELKFYR